MANDFVPGATPLNPVGFIAEGLNAGLSGNQILRDLSEAGAGIRRQTGLRLIAEVRDSIARQESAAALDPFALPGPNDYATWTMGPGNQYATSVSVFFRDRDTGLIGTQQYLYKTADPHTPAEAEAAAWADYSDPDAEEQYNRTAVGTRTKNVYQTVRYDLGG